MEDKEQLSVWKQVHIRNRIQLVHIQNRIQTKIPGSKTSFEFGPNLLGV
jgi:hypothetical protein